MRLVDTVNDRFIAEVERHGTDLDQQFTGLGRWGFSLSLLQVVQANIFQKPSFRVPLRSKWTPDGRLDSLCIQSIVPLKPLQIEVQRRTRLLPVGKKTQSIPPLGDLNGILSVNARVRSARGIRQLYQGGGGNTNGAPLHHKVDSGVGGVSGRRMLFPAHHPQGQFDGRRAAIFYERVKAGCVSISPAPFHSEALSRA